MNSLFTNKIVLIFCFLSLLTYSWAQKQTPLDIALRYTEQEHTRWQLDKADVANMLVSDQYRTKHNGLTHIYFLQTHSNIPVHNAILGVHVTKDGKVGFANSRFVPNVATKVNAIAPLITAEQAIIYAAKHLNLSGKPAPIFKNPIGKNELLFEDKTISQSPIKVRLMYQRLETGKVHLAWDMAIEQINTPDHWSVRIDALNGDLLDKNNWTVYCDFSKEKTHAHNETCKPQTPSAFTNVEQALSNSTFFNIDNAQYNVFPIPAESPLHGRRQLVTNPADTLASPFGWHDTDGAAGAEHFITRGNNAHAYQDTTDRDLSSQDEPKSNQNLLFDFPLNLSAEPRTYRDASVTQLFYMTNIMHDFTYYYGFDEEAGNFQQNNYQKGGLEEDYVRAEAQDGGSTNNANFNTPPDGGSGRMQMYLWSAPINVPLAVLSPASIAKTYETGRADFGPRFSAIPVTGQLVEAVPRLGCDSILQNANELRGKIAVIERGNCFFKQKVLNAQRAGAIGVVICNNENALLTMANSATLPNPLIPAVLLQSSDCVRIRERLREGVTATIQLPLTPGPANLDAALDNGIVAHEYGHGISTRLVGGPANADCLNNNEQMGEGWSDFFTLITSAKPGDVGARPRGIGTFVQNLDTTAQGIRRVRYSTDALVNAQTYDDIIGTAAPHPLGEVWTDMLWDLYWKLSEVYGWDENLYGGKGGNNLAIQLVIDGLKLLSCNPGFTDGRDAILAADLINNEGANQCLIWEVFARRGLGVNADQGSAYNRNDGRQGFEILPKCLKTLKVRKVVTPLIFAGQTIIDSIIVTNHKDQAVTNVVVTDKLSVGTNYISGSAAAAGVTVTTEAGAIQFKIESLQPNEEKVITYKVSTPSDKRSIRQFIENNEGDTLNWRVDSLTGRDRWRTSTQRAFSGTKAWFVPNTSRSNDQILRLLKPVQVIGRQPVLRFYHNYDTDPGLDGGLIQISADSGRTWQNTDALLFRNGYRGRIAPATFALPNLQAYSGVSSGFVDSYLDLNRFLGQEIAVRFRFASQEQATNRANSGTGWYVDDVELLDLFNYQSEVCVTTTQGDQVCAAAPARGTIVQPVPLSTPTQEVENANLQVRVYPNPASDVVNVTINTPFTQEVALSIFNAEGRLMQSQQNILLNGMQTIPLQISNLQAGFYLIEIKTENAILTQKLVVQ